MAKKVPVPRAAGNRSKGAPKHRARDKALRPPKPSPARTCAIPFADGPTEGPEFVTIRIRESVLRKVRRQREKLFSGCENLLISLAAILGFTLEEWICMLADAFFNKTNPALFLDVSIEHRWRMSRILGAVYGAARDRDLPAFEAFAKLAAKQLKQRNPDASKSLRSERKKQEQVDTAIMLRDEIAWALSKNPSQGASELAKRFVGQLFGSKGFDVLTQHLPNLPIPQTKRHFRSDDLPGSLQPSVVSVQKAMSEVLLNRSPKEPVRATAERLIRGALRSLGYPSAKAKHLFAWAD